MKRDIRDIKVWNSIREFMDSIREQDFAVLLISKEYLKSYNCMYEVLEIMKEKVYQERIFPAVLEKKIYSIKEKAKELCEKARYISEKVLGEKCL